MNAVVRKALVWSGLALLVPLTAYAIWTYTLSRELEERLEEIRARGEPARFEELEPPRPPDDRNAAPLYQKAKEWLSEHEIEHAEPLDTLLLSRNEWGDEHWAEVRAWVDSCEPYIVLIHEATARPECWFERDWTNPIEMSIPLISIAMDAAGLLQLRALLDAREGSGSMRSVRHIEALMKLAGHQFPSTLITYLVRLTHEGMAVETLKEIVKHPELDARAVRARLDPLFRAAERPGAFRHVLAAERAMGLYFALEATALSSWPARPLAYMDALALLDVMAEAIELSEQPREQAVAGYEALRRRTEARGFPYIATKMLMPIPGRAFKEVTKHTAMMRLARIGLAVLEHKQRTGSWPDALEDSMPPDPFTNKPFYYRRHGSGVRLAADAPIGPNDLLEDYEWLVWELD